MSRIVVDAVTGEVIVDDTYEPEIVPPTLDERLAAIDADFAAKKAALQSRLSTIGLIDGADEVTKKAALQTEYVQLCDERAAAIDALILGS